MIMNTPLLPKNKITSCIIGECYYNEIKELADLGINCITTPPNKALDNEISCHADILAFNCGNGTILAQKDVAGDLQNKINGYNVISVGEITSPYPGDVGLNVFFDGKRLFGNSQYIKKELSDFCTENNIDIIHTNQGYAKCSICAVSENAVITEDEGLAYLLKNYQYDVLKITKGYVALSDKHYGFIGGASAKVSDKELYISGDIGAHPDYAQIKAFTDKYNISLIYNKNRPLTDFGGIINII